MEQQTARVAVLGCVVLLAVALAPVVAVVLVVVVAITLAAALAAAVVKVADLVVTQVVRRLVRVAAGMMDVPAVVQQLVERIVLEGAKEIAAVYALRVVERPVYQHLENLNCRR